MPNLPQQKTIVQYLGDGVTTAFYYNFLVPTPADVSVYVQPLDAQVDPTTQKQVLNSDYTVQGAGITDGGTITFTTPPAFSSIVTITRQMEFSLDVQFSNATNFSGANLDAVLTRLLLLCQDLYTLGIDRSLSYLINSYLPSTDNNTALPVLEDGQIWKKVNDAVIGVTLDESIDVTTLRSELESTAPGGDGASVIGMYDSINNVPTNVHDYLINFTETVLPSGLMMDFAGETAPAGWLICDGSAVSRTTYAGLFATIGTTWGIGNGTTTFNLPDLRRRVTVGAGGTSTSILGNVVGNVGGAETHLITQTEMPAHTHGAAPITLLVNDSNGDYANGVRITPSIINQPVIEGGFVSGNTASTGGADPMSLMQPSAVVNKIIRI